MRLLAALSLAVAALAPLPGTAQTEQRPLTADDPQALLTPFRDCLVAYGKRFAPTAALPQDVADAAALVCDPMLGPWLSSAASQGLKPESVQKLRENLQARSRGVTIGATLEARYPKK